MEIIQDPALMAAVREESAQAWVRDSESGELHLDSQKLVALPLLQSMYTDVMRLRISYIVSRKVVRPVIVDGFKLPAGSLLQGCTELAHRDEAVWGTDAHPASEFWAYRHVKEVDAVVDGGKTTKTYQFSMRGRPSSFFPYSMSFPCMGHFVQSTNTLPFNTNENVFRTIQVAVIGYVRGVTSPSKRS